MFERHELVDDGQTLNGSPIYVYQGIRSKELWYVLNKDGLYYSFYCTIGDLVHTCSTGEEERLECFELSSCPDGTDFGDWEEEHIQRWLNKCNAILNERGGDTGE